MEKFDKKNYDETHRIRLSLFLNKENDADIIAAIDPKNKQGSIKHLIRKGIKK